MPLLRPTTDLAELPDSPGIYLFYNIQKELIYVGKATSLKQRVRSYFRSHPPQSPLPSHSTGHGGQGGGLIIRPIEEMIHEVDLIDFNVTDSVLEAIILESLFIKRHLPRYNVLGKDDKSWNYLVLTKEVFPRIKAIRQHEIETLKHKNIKALKQYTKIYGPYPGLNTAAALKLLRRLFHVSDCSPNRGRPCLYREMGQCLGVCTGDITAAQYRQQVIEPLTLFLKGEKKRVVQSLERRMREASKGQQFEEASRWRDQLAALQRIRDIALINESFVRDVSSFKFGSDYGGIATSADANRLPCNDTKNFRIEGYDISNLGATDKVGSMVVFDESGPVKNQYRKFNIKTVVGQSDVDCLAEVLERRLNHAEWPLPQVFLIDGGRPQVNRAREVLARRGVVVSLIGIAKGPERKRNDIILGDKLPETTLFASRFLPLLIRVRDEAHRFAITFNRSKRSIKTREH